MLKLIALLSPLFVNLYATILLLFTSNKQYKNRFYLGLFFLNSFTLFIGHFLSFYKYWSFFKYYDGVFLSTLLAFYPLYYLYIRNAFSFRLIKTKWIFHFIPAILIGVTMTIMALSASWEDYQMYMNNNLYNTKTTTTHSTILTWLYKGARYFHLVQIVVYNLIVIRFILSTKSKMKNLFSNLDKFQIRYFYLVTISYIILMSIPGFYVTLIGRTPLNENELQLFFICTLFTLLYLILAIVGLRQIPVNSSGNKQFIEENVNRGTIQFKEINMIEKSLTNYFTTSKPWLNPHLNIWDVSKAIGSNRSYVSRVINENKGCNFNDFVNIYRINKAKQLLLNSKLLSINEISEKSGFGSVNSFIRIFKKTENCTPNQFRKKNN